MENILSFEEFIVEKKFKSLNKSSEIKIVPKRDRNKNKYYDVGANIAAIEISDKYPVKKFKEWSKNAIKSAFPNSYIQNEKIKTDNLNSNFKKWFGDSVTIKNENPSVFYHGTDKKFKIFDKSKIDPDGFHGKGFYFYNNPIAKEYYGKALKCYLKIEHPYNMDDILSNMDEIKFILGDKFKKCKQYITDNIEYGILKSEIYRFIDNDRLIALGYDGIIHGDVAIVFEPNQIKSVNNDGTWNVDDNDIYS